jgi:hypothetical protein
MSVVERLQIAVTYDAVRGYVATVPGLPPVTALSLGGLRRRIEVALLPEEVIVVLNLDRVARQERDRRRRGPGFARCIELSKVQSVDQRMRLECGVGFRQLRTCRRIRPRQVCARLGHRSSLDHLVGDREQAGRNGEVECPRRLQVDDELEFG